MPLTNSMTLRAAAGYRNRKAPAEYINNENGTINTAAAAAANSNIKRSNRSGRGVIASVVPVI